MKRFIKLLLFTSCMMGIQPILAQDAGWVRDNTWYFDNFKKDSLPWEWFRETFLGIAPVPSGDFDLIFYNELYKTKLCKPGHCFGMSAMALLMLKNGGYLGYCHPPYMYAGGDDGPDDGPDDPTLAMALALVHGNQIAHGFLAYYLDIIAKNKNRDGEYAYQQVLYYLSKEDYPIINITKDLSPADGGHVMVPYYAGDFGSEKRIYVYDPSRPYDTPGPNYHDWYENGQNYITVKSNGEWSFRKENDSIWTGSPGGGGNCIATPLSIAGKKDRLPQSLIAEGAWAINTIFIFGEDVQLDQISDPSTKRRLFNEERTDWETHPDRRLGNVLPFIPMGEAGSKANKSSQVYFVRGDKAMDLRIKACGPYRIGLLFQGKYIEYSGVGDGKVQQYRTLGKLLHPKKPVVPKFSNLID